MTLKQIFAALLSAFVTLNLVILLLGSWQQPQIQSRLELYQTDLLLHATELKADQEIAADTQAELADQLDAEICAIKARLKLMQR